MDENNRHNPIYSGGDDDFVIGKGFSVDAFSEPADQKRPKKKKKKKKGRGILRSIIWVISIIVISVGISFGLIYVGADYLGIGFGRGEDCVMEIKQGSPTVTIAEKLQETGAVKCPLVFRLYSKLKHFDAQYKYGVYSFNSEAGYEELAEMLMTEGAKAKTVSVTIPEMATVDDIVKLLEDNGVCKKGDFMAALQDDHYDYPFVDEIPSERVYYRLEGYLYPETYDFYCYDNSEECAHLAVDKMLKQLNEKITPEMKTAIEGSKYSFHELMTLASLVESESANGSEQDRAKVAQIFYNRLQGINWDGPKFLQTDPSTKYPHGGGRYNTYEIEGLPPGPIGSPSVRSINAVLSPDTTSKATYFVTDKNGAFYFNETLAAHNKIIAELKKKGLWLYTTLG